MTEPNEQQSYRDTGEAAKPPTPPAHDRGERPRDEAEIQRRFLAIARRLQKGRTYTPFLFIPYKLVNPTVPGQTPDLGRVRPIPGGEAFWASPYIVVESRLGLGFTAVAGEENFVHARVFNLGKASARPTQVDFYWADPSLGLPPGAFNFIGTRWVDIAHGHSKDVRCDVPWVPTFLNNGHECLLVQCSNPKMAVGAGGPPGNFDPITGPFRPTLDRHVGQRNIHVNQAAPAAMNEMRLHICNVFPFAMATTIRACTKRVAVAGGSEKRHSFETIVSQVAAFDPRAAGESPEGGLVLRAVPRRRVPTVASTIEDAPQTVEVDRAFAGELLQSSHESQSRGRLDACEGIVLHELSMKPGELRTMHVQFEVPADARAGEFIVFTLIQSSHDLMIGGYTVVVAVR